MMKYNLRAGLLLLLLLLTSCVVTTDRLAVYENTLLSQSEINELVGHYHMLDEKGNFNSLSIKPRSATWGSQNGSQQFIATNVVYKSGGSIPFHYEGVGILSRIPETDFILVGIPGKSIRFREEGKMISVPAKEMESANKNNHLFMIKKNGQALEFLLPSYYAKELEKAFAKPKEPLPTEKYLNYLKENFQTIIQSEGISTYLKSSPNLETIVEKKIDDVLSEEEKKNQEKRKKRLETEQPSSKENPSTEKKAGPTGSISSKNSETLKPQPEKHSRTKGSKKPEAPRIESIEGYYAVSSEDIIQFKLYKKHKASYEYKGIQKFRSDPWGFRHVPRNVYVNHGHWYPDSQQFYYVTLFENKGGCSGDWSEWNWSYPVEYEEVVQKNKKVPAWGPNILSRKPIPAGRKKKRICIQQSIRKSDCSFIRCTKRADPQRARDFHIVRTLQDAIWIYKNHYGNR